MHVDVDDPADAELHTPTINMEQTYFWPYPDTENHCPQFLIIGLVCLENLQLNIPEITPHNLLGGLAHFARTRHDFG